MKKTKRLWLGFSLTSVLMAGTSLGGSYYVLESFEPELYQEKQIVIGKDTLSQDEFAENIKEKDGIWYYRNPQKKSLTDLNVLSDYRTQGDHRYRWYQTLQLEKVIDTIVVKKDRNIGKLYYFYGPNDSIENLPSMGRQSGNRLRIRHFVSDDPAVQAQLNIYNDAYNCTERHEKQHFLNAQNGMAQSGRSYETVFGDNCMDEVAANLAQFKEQRKNYLEHGRDEAYITPRFNFYKEWIARHPVDTTAATTGTTAGCLNYEQIWADTCFCDVADEIARFVDWKKNHTKFGAKIPGEFKFYGKWINNHGLTAEDMSEEEAAFVADCVFNSWMKDKFPLYVKSSAKRAVHLLDKADYNGCQDHPEEHTRLMHKIFNIDGIDFYRYIAGREKEFIDKLPQEYKDEFVSRLKIKKQKMDYFQKVGQITQNDPQKKNIHFRNVKFKHEWNKFINRLTGRGK